MPQDVREAVRLFHLAADQRDAAAQYELEVFHLHRGYGVPQDDAEAARLFRLAADQGDAAAQHALGLSCREGKGLPKDQRKAARLFRLAARQGHAPAQLSLGTVLVMGDTESAVPTRPREGALLLAQAAQQDEDEGCKAKALATLREFADMRELVHACCIGCGKSRRLKLCGKCRVAKFCGAECIKRMWPVHQPCCRQWAVESERAGAA